VCGGVVVLWLMWEGVFEGWWCVCGQEDIVRKDVVNGIFYFVFIFIQSVCV
jgi:hypothetical protein